jgi:peptidase E
VSPEPTIVAIGGGVLLEDPNQQLIETYILSLTGKDDPRVCFIGTATGDNPANIVRFYSVFTQHRCRPSHLALIDRKVSDLGAFLLAQDVIFVGGGNTNAMLAVWRQHEVDAILREAWQKGIVLCGGSAGANCWHESSTTDSWGLPLRPLNDGLGFVPGSFCPHYDVEVTRRPLYREWVSKGLLSAGYACDNGVAVHYEGTAVRAVVASLPEARAYRLEQDGSGGYRETEIVPRFLGS